MIFLLFCFPPKLSTWWHGIDVGLVDEHLVNRWNTSMSETRKFSSELINNYGRTEGPIIINNWVYNLLFLLKSNYLFLNLFFRITYIPYIKQPADFQMGHPSIRHKRSGATGRMHFLFRSRLQAKGTLHGERLVDCLHTYHSPHSA